MPTLTISRNLRLALLAVTIVAIAAFGIFGAGWATPARADNNCGTVPCPNPTSGAGNGSGGGGGGGGGAGNTGNTGGSGISGPCGAGAQTFTLTGPDKVTQLLKVGIGTVMLLSNEAGVGTGAVRLSFTPTVTLTVNLIAPAQLPANPAGWTNLGCGIRDSAAVADGQAATFIRKGQQVCFALPVGAAAAYKSLRIAYWDATLGRWVFLTTLVGPDMACHSSFRLLPTTFALFGGA